jgi:hypothetical protein
VIYSIKYLSMEQVDEQKNDKKSNTRINLVKVPSKPTYGQVRVAKYFLGKPEPETKGFRNILIHTSPYGLGGPLSPYVLRNEKGQLLENIWQFSKIYPKVTKQKIPLSRFHPNNIIWEHPEEVHMDPFSGEPTPTYWAWREKGENNRYAVRYPNGFHGRTSCICSLWPHKSPEKLGYIEARKKIYCGEYIRLAPQTESFKKLRALLSQGVNLQLIEVDGPDPSLTYPPYNEISTEYPGMLMCEKTIRMLIDDPRKPFGHGFVIAALLLNGSEWMQ